MEAMLAVQRAQLTHLEVFLGRLKARRVEVRSFLSFTASWEGIVSSQRVYFSRCQIYGVYILLNLIY